jgi:ammonia channel protein AmtB
LNFSAATVNGFLGIILLALEAVIGTRFLLLAFGANKSSGFVSFMFDLSWPFVRPFSNAFRTHSWDQGIIEPASILAICVYATVFAFAMLLVRAVVPEVRERHAVERIRSTRV